MLGDDRDRWDRECWDYYGYIYDEPEGTPKKTSPTPFIVFVIAIIVIHFIGGSTVATPIAWIGIILLLILRFIGWV